MQKLKNAVNRNINGLRTLSHTINSLHDIIKEDSLLILSTLAIGGDMLGFLVKTYPKISETFVLQEILELQDEPFGMNIFSMQQPKNEKFHCEFSSITVDVNYLSRKYWCRWSVIITHFMFILKRLWPYLSTLKFSLTRPEGGSFGQFCQAVYFSYLIQKKGIRHIHVPFDSESTGLAELVNRLCGISYSITAHAKDFYLQKPSLLLRKIAQAQFVVTSSDYNWRFLQAINKSETSIYRGYHGINSARVSAENVRFTVKPKMMRILNVGRQREKKGFPTLISACQLLVQAGYKFQCDIVGYGHDREELEGLIEHYQLNDTVRLLGEVENNTQDTLDRQTTISEVPSQIVHDAGRHGISNALMAAMSVSSPIMTTDISGIPELIENNKAGLVIEAKNYLALFIPLQYFLDNPKLFMQLNDAGKKCVISHFAVDQHIGHLKQLLTHALQQKNDIGFLA